MNAEPDRPGCPKDGLAAAQARIRRLEAQLSEAEQELQSASDIIHEQDINIECLRLQLEAADLAIDEAVETCRRLERRIADLDNAGSNDDPCPVIVPVPQEQAPPQQPDYPPDYRPKALVEAISVSSNPGRGSEVAVAVVEKRPFWFGQVKRLVEKCWNHHGPCGSVRLDSALDVENGLWLFRASPVFQEVFGGKDDGKIVWTGFEFHTDKLMRGMTVWGVSGKSCCPDCISTPTITIRGSYRAHSIRLTILLEPIPGSPVVEIIDTLKCEIRPK